MGAVPDFLLTHTVQVEPFAGEGAYGPTYSAARAVRCFVDDKRQRVLNEVGTEVISSTTVYMGLSESCPARSRITFDDGRVTHVIAVARRDGRGLPTPDHLEVSCQ